jgi:hypothetical protein
MGVTGLVAAHLTYLLKSRSLLPFSPSAFFPKVREPSCSSQKTHAFHTSYKKATKENNKMFVEDHLIAKTDGVTPLVSIQKQRHHLLQIQFSNSKLFQIFENSTLLRNFKLFYMQVVPT